MRRLRWISFAFAPALVAATCTPAQAFAAPSAADALKVTPIQANVDYDQPAADQIARCTLKMEKIGSANGWVVRDPDGRILRRFVDTNGDNKLDQWHYYKNNVQVYRDIDSDFNRKADQYRWLGAGGARWGVDENEDGRIDRWRQISAEEVSLVIVEALKSADADLFATVLLSDKELADLDLSKEHRDRIGVRLRNARSGFAELAKRQKAVGETTKWLHFGGSQPGVVLHDTATDGVLVYDNVAAIVDGDGGHQQVNIGTLVQVGRTWKAISLPRNLEGESVAAEGFFFQQAGQPASTLAGAAPGGISPAAQDLLDEMEKLDRDLAATSSATRQGQLQAKRADLLERLISATTGEDKAIWVRQFADTISSAAQSGAFKDGVKRLETLDKRLTGEDDELRAYVRFRLLTAQYGLELQDPQADYAKIQKSWMERLEAFSKRFPKSPDSGEAMLQLAIAKEFAGEQKDAIRWYERIATDFADQPIAAKARGAVARIRSVGRPLSFTGKSLEGEEIDLADYRGKVVVLHYWASWCSQDLPVLKDLYGRYANRGVAVIGVNVDNSRSELDRFLRSNRLAWPQLHSEKGLDGELANRLGILTPPTIFLIDQQGRVVRNDLHGQELGEELRKLVR